MVLGFGVWPLTLVERVGLSVTLLQRALVDWGSTVWFFILTIAVTSYFLFSFSTTSQTASKGFSWNVGSDMDQTWGLSTPVPDAVMPIKGKVEFEDVTREGFWSVGAWLLETFFSGQEEKRWPAFSHFQHVGLWPVTITRSFKFPTSNALI